MKQLKKIEIIRPSYIRIVVEERCQCGIVTQERDIERYIPLPKGEVEALDFARQVARDEGYDVPCDSPVSDWKFTSRMDLSRITTSPIAKNHGGVK